ncbi:ABC transporter permease [Paracoccus sp. NSM]|uniref:ABC transporter permease n=1 Tax=Paracoccus sp. NSM TaxID=3457784 RepID=UPI004036BBD4
MDNAAFVRAFDRRVDDGLFWLSDHAGFLFDGLRAGLEGTFRLVQGLLHLPPAWLLTLLVAVAGWRVVGRRFGLLAGAGLLLCLAMGLWGATVDTLALVVTAVSLSLLIAIPVGVLAGYLSSLDRAVEAVLDLIQTMPPYIYLLPAIALLGYGAATALFATIIVAIPPAIRLTSLGIRRTPKEFIELGQASGITPRQMFFKIRLPFALPSIMAGVNQSIMMAFGMVVIAGIVGAGGLGAAIYDAIRTLDIAKSINAAIAIVVLTMVLDRMTQALGPKAETQ